MEINRIRISLKTVTNEEQKPVETVVLLLEQVAFIMFIFKSTLFPGAVFIYKVKRGNFGITVQKYPHTQQHIIHKAPRLYI